MLLELASLAYSVLPDDKKKKIQEAVGTAIDIGFDAIGINDNNNNNNNNNNKDIPNGTFFSIENHYTETDIAKMIEEDIQGFEEEINKRYTETDIAKMIEEDIQGFEEERNKR